MDHCGSLWDRCGSLWVVVGPLWIVVGRCGIVVDHCGSLWVVVDHCGSFRVVVTTLLSLFFGVFFELVFNSDCIRQKGECSPNAAWSESFWSGENKLHHRKARVYETICTRSLVSRSFYSGPSVSCLVRM